MYCPHRPRITYTVPLKTGSWMSEFSVSSYFNMKFDKHTAINQIHCGITIKRSYRRKMSHLTMLCSLVTSFIHFITVFIEFETGME